MMKKALLATMILSVCLAIALIWQRPTPVVPVAEAVVQGWEHCFCYDIGGPAKTVSENGDHVWLCKDGFFVTSITQKGEGGEADTNDVAHIKEMQCCSLCR